jgi:hypothetical protein
MASIERGTIESTALETRKWGTIGAFFAVFISYGALALAVGVAGMSHIIAKHEERKRKKGG